MWRAMFASVQGDYDVAHTVAVNSASAKAGAHLRVQPHVLLAIIECLRHSGNKDTFQCDATRKLTDMGLAKGPFKETKKDVRTLWQRYLQEVQKWDIKEKGKAEEGAGVAQAMDVDVEESQHPQPSQSLSEAISISKSQISTESLPDSNAQSLSQAILISDSNSQSLSQSHSESQPLSQKIPDPNSLSIPQAPSNSDSQSQFVPESSLSAILRKEPLVPCPNCGLLCALRNLQKHIDKGSCAKGLENAKRVQCDICFGWFGVHGSDAHYGGCLRKGPPEDRGQPKKIMRTSNVPSIASFFQKAKPAGLLERDLVFGEDCQPEPEPKPAPEPEPEPNPEPEPAAEFEDAELPLLPSFHGDRVDAGVKCMFPFMPPAFPVQTPNPLLKVTELQCTGSMDSADKDTAKQEELRAEFIN